ncbi:hypothetical protein EJB05_35943 [Eragrostis curvula]|uniref:GDSL esterase/lipase n=1 Tax=Eragrostis curvula TaxID=38414 RepID=A0A5J9U7U4_9POAL|nr:hypothetical protein EJB05_35943 [Eragrostis curvula]
MARRIATVAIFLAAAVLLSSPLAGAARAAPPSPSPKQDIPAVFAFGDSTLDPGNNNRLNTLVRADHAPYGRDFPGGDATGRFSDGKLITDYIVESLGIKELLPAYHDPSLTDAEAATGVSFASGGSGLDDLTTRTAMVSTFASQIDDFKELLGRIGAPKAAEIAGKALYVLSAGTNDVTMYTVLPIQASNYPSFDEYSDFLIVRFQSYIKKTLHVLLPPLAFGGCSERPNADAQMYNTKLQQMLTKLEANCSGSTFAYVDVYTPLLDMATNPRKYGFSQTGLGCCGTGLVEMGELCTNLLPLCPSPGSYMFFDSVHPTQATYKQLADQIVQSNIPKFK